MLASISCEIYLKGMFACVHPFFGSVLRTFPGYNNWVDIRGCRTFVVIWSAVVSENEKIFISLVAPATVGNPRPVLAWSPLGPKRQVLPKLVAGVPAEVLRLREVLGITCTG